MVVEPEERECRSLLERSGAGHNPTSPGRRLVRLLGVGAVVASWSLAGCSNIKVGASGKSNEADAADAEGSAVAPVPIAVGRVTRRDVEKSVAATASARSTREVAVQSLASGRLVELNVKVGDVVAAGAVLGRVDAPDAPLALREAEQSLAKIVEEQQRVSPLVEKGFLARAALDELEVRRIAAVGARDRARAHVDDGLVRAPLAGVVSRRTVEPGVAVGPGQTLVELVDPASLEVAFAVPERWLTEVKPGSVVRLTADALGNAEWSGAITSIDPTVDPTSGTATVRVALDAAAQPGLRAGMFIRARFVVDVHKQTLTISKRAVLFRGQDASVFRVSGEGSGATVERADITLGYEAGEWVEVLTGLREGDVVVEAGQTGLDAGTHVVVQRSEGSGK